MKKGTKIIVANWKMNPASLEEAVKINKSITATATETKKVQTIICPSHLHISHLINLQKSTKNKSKTSAKSAKNTVLYGVQDFFTEEKGSFTGEVSVGMVASLGATYAIIGHSERRGMGETDDIINKKVLLALKHKIIPIICVGEKTRDDEGQYLGFIKEQLEKALVHVKREDLGNIVIAYEPIWAIGATKAMDSHDVHQMMILITKILFDIYKIKDHRPVPILYGGSVDPTNAHGILTNGQADGLLIGRQSLDPKAFSEIITIANTL